jgi:hypothetical protein
MIGIAVICLLLCGGILWNATNRYSAEGLLGADEVEDNENNQ